MYDAVAALQIKEPIEFRRGNMVKPLVRVFDPEEEEEEEKPEDEWLIREKEESQDRVAECAEHMRKSIKRPKAKPRGTRNFSDEARERMDQRFYERQRALEGTLTGRQKEIVTDYANGFLYRSMARKYGICLETVRNTLYKARKRMDARNNVHLVKLCVQKGLIS